MRTSGLISIFLLLCVSAAGCFAQGTIEGRVELPKKRSAPVAAQRYEIVSNHGILATSPPLAVVYLEVSPGRGATGVTKEVAQKDLAFIPALLAVQVGTKVEFPNHDDTYHN